MRQLTLPSGHLFVFAMLLVGCRFAPSHQSRTGPVSSSVFLSFPHLFPPSPVLYVSTWYFAETSHLSQSLFSPVTTNKPVSVFCSRALQNFAIVEHGGALTDETHLTDPPTKQLGALLPTLAPFNTALAITHESFWTHLASYT